MAKHSSAVSDHPVVKRNLPQAYASLLARCHVVGVEGNKSVGNAVGCYWPRPYKTVRGDRPGWEIFIVACPVWKKV